MSDTFDHEADAWDDLLFGRSADEGYGWTRSRSRPRSNYYQRRVMCRYCGSTDVRWVQKNGHWVLFSMTPGVVHRCPRDTAEYEFGGYHR